MDDQSNEALYNDFITYLLQDTDTPIRDILLGTVHWPGPLLLQGTLNTDNVITCLYRLKEENAQVVILCSTLLYMLCADRDECVKTLIEQNDTSLWTTHSFLNLTGFVFDIQSPLVIHTAQNIDSVWERAFIGTIVMIGFAESLSAKMLHPTIELFETPFFVHYVALLAILYEPAILDGKRIDITIVQDLAQFDLSGPKLTTVGTQGELFAKTFMSCLGHPDIMNRCRKIVMSVDNVDHPFARLIYRPFYKFNTLERVYTLLEKLEGVADSIDLEDDERNDCTICYAAQVSVKMQPCDHGLCAQCLRRMFHKASNSTCPFCRTEIQDLDIKS